MVVETEDVSPSWVRVRVRVRVSWPRKLLASMPKLCAPLGSPISSSSRCNFEPDEIFLIDNCRHEHNRPTDPQSSMFFCSSIIRKPTDGHSYDRAVCGSSSRSSSSSSPTARTYMFNARKVFKKLERLVKIVHEVLVADDGNILESLHAALQLRVKPEPAACRRGVARSPAS